LDLILHLGAHRTGSTAFQQMLTAGRARLAQAGVRALVHDELGRLPGFAAIGTGTGGGSAAARAALDAALAGADRALISEENLIGDMGWNIRAGSFYNRARDRLTAYRDLFGAAPSRIGLGVRGYAGYWVSAHAYELSYRTGVPVRFDDRRADLVAAERGWRDLAGDIRAVFPDAAILVWDADLRLPLPHLAQRLLGDDDVMLEPPPPGVNAAPATGLIPAMETHRTAHPMLSRMQMRGWLATRQPGVFQGFTEEQTALMDARYADDIRAFAAGDAGVELINPCYPGAGSGNDRETLKSHHRPRDELSEGPAQIDLILHLGAHETGSTALVRCLEKNQDHLAAAGVALRPPEVLRAMPDFAPVLELTRRAAEGDAVAGGQLDVLRDRLATDAADAERQGTLRLILSDENMVGTMLAALKSRIIYRDAAARVAAYASVLPKPPTLIAFAVRSYAPWWQSAYAFVLQRHPLPPFGALGEALAQGGRGWVDVVRDLRGVFPGVPVLIWRHEAFADSMTRVVAALAGLAGTDGLQPVTARVNPAHLRRQVDQIHRLRKDDPTLAGKALAARLAMLGEVKGRPPSFRPPQKAALEARYETDLETLRAEPGVTLL
jgi:hypothetical protein